MEGGILLMEFDSSNLKLDFNNINQELPPELFDIVVNTIEETSVVCPEFVIGNHFTDKSKLSLSDWGFFLFFKNDKTLQSDIEALNTCNNKIDTLTKKLQILENCKNLYDKIKTFEKWCNHFFRNIRPY